MPGLAAVLVGNDPASEVYVRNKSKACQQVGMFTETYNLPATASEAEVLALVARLNRDDRFDGILVQLPLPPQVRAEVVYRTVAEEKDVDGLNPASLGRLVLGLPGFVPATPYGIQQMLVRSGHDPAGKHVVICGRSDLVGKPLALLLMQKAQGSNATVTVCHTGTPNLASYTRQADILVAAIGSPEFITGDMLKDGVVVVDVGINRVNDPKTKRGYRLVGDVEFQSASQRASAITPVPGGVGPVTIAMLIANTVPAAQRRRLAPSPSGARG